MDDSRFKFRAWDEVNKVMLYSCKDYTVWVGGVESRVTADTWGRNISYEFVMQYTGLKDKNGKEIYEGDILMTSITIEAQNGENFDYYNSHEDGSRTKMSCSPKPAVVKFAESQYFFEHISGVQKPFWVCVKDIKNKDLVIGNIYENPELLEAK